MALNGQQTLANIQAQQAAYLLNQGTLSTTTFPTEAMMLALTNKWYKRFVSAHLWQWNTVEGTFNTVIGQQRYAMPDNTTKPQNFTIRNIAKSIPVYTRQKFLAMYPSGWNNTGNGIPMIAVEAIPSADNSRQYDLWPIPNAVYTVNYDAFGYVNPLVNPGDYSIIPPDYDDILIHGPVSDAFTMQDDERSAYHQTEAEAILQRAWLENENMISMINQARGQDADGGQALIFPYHPY